MIPISSDHHLEVLDKSSGLTFKFRYITGSEYQARFLALMDSEQVVYEKIKKDLPVVENEEKKEKDNRFLDALTKYRASNISETIGVYDEYIDLFLSGWTKKDGVPSFPENGKPSQMFSYSDKLSLYTIIQEHFYELTGLKGEEVKN